MTEPRGPGDERRREKIKADQPLPPGGASRVKELEDEVGRLRMENEFPKRAAAFFARTHQ
jgi:transposase